MVDCFRVYVEFRVIDVGGLEVLISLDDCSVDSLVFDIFGSYAYLFCISNSVAQSAVIWGVCMGTSFEKECSGGPDKYWKGCGSDT